MSKGIKIDFGNAGYTYDVYTSSSRTGTYTLYTSGFTGQILTITGSSITGTELFVKTTCPHCKDQIVRVRLEPEPISLTGSTVNGTCENCGDTDEPECNGAITLYVCGGVRPFTYQWSGSTKSGKVITASTKDLGYLEEGNYNVIVSDSYGITGTTGFTIDVAPCNPPRNLSAVAPIPPTATPTPTPTNTTTPTPTPSPTMTATPTPTPTPSPEATDTDLYYYYALGDCSQMGYTTTSITNTGFGIISLTGLCSSNIGNTLADPAHTSYYTDYNDPCGFASGYTYSVYGKSLKTNTHIPEGTVFTIGDQCLSVVWLDQYVPPSLSTISLDNLTPEPGDNPCYTCQPPFTGLTFNWYVYGATRCDNDENILVYSIFPYTYDATPYGLTEFGLPELSSLQTGLTYGMVTFNELGNVIDDGYCATITSYFGAFSGQTVQVPILPLTDPVLYKNLPVGVQAVEGHYLSDCNVECSSLYYYNFTERCDGQISLDNDPIWSTTKLNVNDIIKDDNGVCRKVTIPGTFKEIKYKGYLQSEIISMVGTKYTNNDCGSCS